MDCRGPSTLFISSVRKKNSSLWIKMSEFVRSRNLRIWSRARFCSSHCFIQQDQMSHRYDSIVQWLQMGNCLMVTYLLFIHYPQSNDSITSKQIDAILGYTCGMQWQWWFFYIKFYFFSPEMLIQCFSLKILCCDLKMKSNWPWRPLWEITTECTAG